MPKPVDAVSQPEPEPEQNGSSAPKGKLAIIFILFVLATGGYYAWAHFRDQVSSDDAQVDGHIVAIAPRIAGHIVEVLVKDNQEVKAGQPLARIDARDYQASVDIAKAEVARAESQLRAAKVVVPWVNATTESAETGAAAQLADTQAEVERARLAYEQAAGSDLGFAEANVRVKQAANERAQADLARMKPLVDKAEISRLQYDSFVAASRMAESDLQASQQKLASAQKDALIRKAELDTAQTRVSQARAGVATSTANRQQVDIRSADAGTAEADVLQARANLAAAELQLSYATITSPIDGVVTRKSVEPGQYVSPGQSLMALIPLHSVWVTANFKETQLAEVHAGQRAEIHVDMYGKSLWGKVDSIAGATGSRMSLLPPENATGNFVKVVQRIPVKILVEQTGGLVLRPGMNVDATIYFN